MIPYPLSNGRWRPTQRILPLGIKEPPLGIPMWPCALIRNAFTNHSPTRIELDLWKHGSHSSRECHQKLLSKNIKCLTEQAWLQTKLWLARHRHRKGHCPRTQSALPTEKEATKSCKLYPIFQRCIYLVSQIRIAAAPNTQVPASKLTHNLSIQSHCCRSTFHFP